jgi:hypothetical protein
MNPSVDSASIPARQAICETGTHREAGPKASRWSWHLSDASGEWPKTIAPKRCSQKSWQMVIPCHSPTDGPIGIEWYCPITEVHHLSVPCCLEVALPASGKDCGPGAAQYSVVAKP